MTTEGEVARAGRRTRRVAIRFVLLYAEGERGGHSAGQVDGEPDGLSDQALQFADAGGAEVGLQIADEDAEASHRYQHVEQNHEFDQ